MKLTRQEMFDKALYGIRAQSGPSAKIVFGELFCLYRGYNGCKCAAGHLIADDEYDDSFETKRIYIPGKKLGWSDEVINLASELQDAHDDAASEAAMAENEDGMIIYGEHVDTAMFFEAYESYMMKLASMEKLSYAPPMDK